MLQNKPCDVFTAWRRGERTGKRIVSPVFRKQIGDVDLDSIDDVFGLLFLRKVLPKRIDERVGVTGRKQHRNDSELTVRRLMDEVRHHWVALAVQLLLARFMKVKQHQLIALFPGRDKAARV